MKLFRQGLLCGVFTAVTAMMSGQDADARDYKNWMAELPDEAYVCTLSIPGTHDSATGHKFAVVGADSRSQTQDLTVEQQLDMGVRAFDFRPGRKRDGFLSGPYRLRCYHGLDEINYWYDDAIKEICSWLETHDKEFVIIHLYPGTNNNDEAGALHNELVADPAVAPHIARFEPNLKVKDMRGKILFLKRYQLTWDSDKIGIMWDWTETDWKEQEMYLKSNGYEERKARIVMQDKANTTPEDKIARFTDLFHYTSSYAPAGERDMMWTLNFASSYNGSTSSRDTYASNAAALLPKIPELLENTTGPMGVVLMDWVGDGLHLEKYDTKGETAVRAIADNNFRYINAMVAQQSAPKHTDMDLTGIFPYHDSFRGNVDWIDLNSDGNLDLVMKGRDMNDGWWPKYMVSYTDGKKLGTGTYLPRPGNEYDDNRSRVVIPIDYNADGHVDLIYGCSAGSVLFSNDGRGNLTKVDAFTLDNKEINLDAQADNTIETRGVEGLMMAADFNLDGFPDILTFGRGDNGTNGTPIIFENMGAATDGAFTLRNSNIPALYNGTMAIGDYNGDGAPDILISGMNSTGNRQISICVNKGMSGSDFNFEVLTPDYLQPYATDYGIVAMVDFNNDGLLDLFVSGRLFDDNKYGKRDNGEEYRLALRAYSANIFIRNEDGSFSKSVTNALPVCNSGMDWCDINGDGYVDVVYGGTTKVFNGYKGSQDHKEDVTGVLINNGDGTFYADHNQFGDVRGGVSVSAADFDGDGKPELAMMGYGNPCMHVYRQETATRAGGVMPMAETKVSIESTPDGKTHLMWNSAENGTRYNYVVETRDGHVYSAVPVDADTGKLRIANMSAAPTGSEVTLNIKQDDIARVGIQAVSSSKQEGALVMQDPKDMKTGVEMISIEENLPVEYFNLQGQRVENPSNGIFIEKRGSKTRKVYIK